MTAVKTDVLMLGPCDHGRPITLEEFLASDGQEGYHYELIDGKVYVSPQPDLPHDVVEEWLSEQLRDYRRQHPEVINYITHKARVFLPRRPRRTAPEPDLAAYHDFPLHLPREELDWRNVSPLLVVEVISPDSPEKDLVRNVDLYLRVPSIREYWVLDTRPIASRPSLRVYRRRGQRWQRPIDVPYGETYETPRLLPGFALVLDPRR